jgi:ankyrin repeat protein
MSFLSLQVSAGLLLVDEFVRRGRGLDQKTIQGPGSFNREWSYLHMACAYGIEPLVKKLLQEKADPRIINCYGYSPLLEACHRGYLNVVSMLLKYMSPDDVDYIPREDLSVQSPFVSAPAQAALAEAARCGFPKIVQLLLDAGCSRDNSNFLGWTALHEACFYNRIETVKVLLLSGSMADRRKIF